MRFMENSAGYGPTDAGVAVRLLKDLGVTDIEDQDLCGVTVVFTVHTGIEETPHASRVMSFGAEDREHILGNFAMAIQAIIDSGNAIAAGEVAPWN